MASHRVRDAKTGRFAAAIEAFRRPAATITETTGGERTYQARKDFHVRKGDRLRVDGRGIRSVAGTMIAERE